MKVYLVDKEWAPRQTDRLEGISLADCKLIWVDVKDPSLEERKYLRNFFDLHPLTAEKPLEAETVPRVVEFKGISSWSGTCCAM